MSETVFLGGNSYGPQVAQVQFAVTGTAGALGTFFRAAKRVNSLTIKNLEDHTIRIYVQENSSLASTGWSNVTLAYNGTTGSYVDVVAKGSMIVDISGHVKKDYLRFYGDCTDGGNSIARVTVNDVELLTHFVQRSPYGQG